jgi:hypothetical protein
MMPIVLIIALDVNKVMVSRVRVTLRVKSGGDGGEIQLTTGNIERMTSRSQTDEP